MHEYNYGNRYRGGVSSQEFMETTFFRRADQQRELSERLKIKPFVLRLLEYIQNSSILYPSNCKLRPYVDRGSIKQTLKGIDIFNYEEKGRLHKLGKPFRAAFRAIIYMAGQFIAAPVGVLYNGSITAYHIVHWIDGKRLGSRSRCESHAKKIQQFGYAFLIDLIITTLQVGQIYTGLYGTYNHIPMTFIEKTFIIGVTQLTLAAPAMDPVDTVNWFFPSALCAGVYKILLLKNNFGIVGKDKPLTFDIEEDQEDYKPGNHIYEMVALGGFRFMQMIQRLQTELPENLRIPKHYPPSTKTIATHLKMHSNEISKTGIQIEEWIQTLEKTERELTSLNRALLNIYKMQVEGNVLFNMMQNKGPINIPYRFPMDEIHTNKYFEPLNIPNGDRNDPKLSFNNSIKDAKTIISQNPSPQGLESTPEKFRELRALVKASKEPIEPYKILGATAPPKDKAQLRKMYLKSVTTHPDRVPKFYDEADALFKCVTSAYAYYDDEFDKLS
jgi:hypothetical protein